MALIDKIIQEAIADKKALDYVLENIILTESTELLENEIVFIYDFSGACTYQSNDEYFVSTLGNRVTQNTGFIEILSGTPTLYAVKATITHYKPELSVNIETDEKGHVTDFKLN